MLVGRTLYANKLSPLLNWSGRTKPRASAWHQEVDLDFLLPSHQDVHQVLMRDEMVYFFRGICLNYYELNRAGKSVVFYGHIWRYR